jgi:hypothetical protein
MGAGGERRGALDVHQVLRQQEQHPQDGDVGAQDRQPAGCHRRASEHAHVEQRLAAAQLHGHERDAGAEAERGRGEHLGAGPARVDALDQREHDTAERQRGQRHPGEVQRRRPGPARLGQPAQSQRRGHQHERHVHQEHPLPPGHVDERAADHRAERETDPRHGGPDPQRPGPQLGREDHRQQRQRRRHHAGRRHPHQHACGDHRLHGLRERGQDRGDREPDEPGQEHAPAAEAVGEAAADQQQPGQRHQERVHHPLELADAGVEVVRHVGQRDVDDRHVHRADEHRHADHGEAQPAPVHQVPRLATSRS